MNLTNTLTPEMQNLKAKMKSVWSAGDFGKIALSIEKGGEEFIERLNLQKGERVLDVACGTGNLALPAARKGAVVTGIDIAPNLLEQARARAGAENLECRFEEGDAENMPYADASFDTVLTMFGAMFAPRPDVTASELVRVCRPKGKIAMANWTPEAFTGQMFKTGAKHVPPPPNIPSPVLWGDEETVRRRLQEGIAELHLARRPITFLYPFSPGEVVEYFRQFFGPTQFAFNALDEQGQAALRQDLEQLWTEHNRATDGTTEVESEYLEVIAVRE
ncbi:MAG: class I SAM-dependent methyltransferase [Pyrinomonadaceae bacterium]